MKEDYSQIGKTLIEFFLDSFAEDAVLVGEWLAQGGQDVDEFYASVLELKQLMNTYS